MKPKQLANVLTRILGLSLCAHGLPSLLGAIASSTVFLVQRMNDGNPNIVNHYSYVNYPTLYWVSPAIEFAIGIYLIFRSRQLVEKLFKDEAE
jgi:hypothetical protein